MPNLRIRLGGRFWLAAVSALALAACDAATPAGTPAAVVAAAAPADDPAWPTAAVADPTTLAFSADGLAALDARMAKSVADGDVAGMVTLLAHKGEVAQFKAYGVQSGDAVTGTPMTQDSIFRIFSMSKPLTGVAMMQLYEQGKWQLDDPVSTYVPEYASMKVLTYGKDGTVVMKSGTPVLSDQTKPATMRELMSHTAGLGYGLCCEDPVNQAFRDTQV
ncbi:MAG: beta-lactamase family protein, partial [Acidobacteriota bacterium]|nr:beta-lactamase family protein [Acidobacteriota bacterium]